MSNLTEACTFSVCKIDNIVSLLSVVDVQWCLWCTDMVSKSTDEGQTPAPSTVLAVWSCRLRLPSQRSSSRYSLPVCTISSSADSCCLPTSRSGSFWLLQRRTPASRRRRRCRRVAVDVPASPGSDQHRRRLRTGTATGGPPATGTCFSDTAHLVAVGQRHHVSQRAETSGSRDISARDDVIVEDRSRGSDAAVSAFRSWREASVTSELKDTRATISLVLVAVTEGCCKRCVVYKEMFFINCDDRLRLIVITRLFVLFNLSLLN